MQINFKYKQKIQIERQNRMISIKVIIRFRVQFGINVHKWVFQKAEIAGAALASAISPFLKNSQVQINFKLNKKNRTITY